VHPSKTVQKYIKSFCPPNKLKKKVSGQHKCTTFHLFQEQKENKKVVFVSSNTNISYICSQFKQNFFQKE